MVQQLQDVQHALDAVNRVFSLAFARQDAAAAASVYTDDATILPPGQSRVRGKDGIRAFWQGLMDGGVREVALQTDDLLVAQSGDLAREIGTATLSIDTASGAEQRATVKFVVVWRHQEGGWRWHTDIWNADA
jgi:uncharacterized protein (TIGR02246 family)